MDPANYDDAIDISFDKAQNVNNSDAVATNTSTNINQTTSFKDGTTSISPTINSNEEGNTISEQNKENQVVDLVDRNEQENSGKNYTTILITVPIILGLIGGIIFFLSNSVFNKKEPIKEPIKEEVIEPPAPRFKTYASCSRGQLKKAVLDTATDMYFVPCSDVLAIAKATGNVMYKITPEIKNDNSYINDIVVKNNKVYMGMSKDGIIIYDISSKTYKKLGLTENLPDESINSLKGDDDLIWIGTKKGLVRLDTKDDSIKVIKDEIKMDVPYSIESILVKKDVLYIIAKTDQSDYLVKYIKVDNTSEVLKNADFGYDNAYLLSVESNLVTTDDGIYFLSMPNDVWKLLDVKQSKPTKVNSTKINATKVYDFSNGYLILGLDSKPENSLVLDVASGKTLLVSKIPDMSVQTTLYDEIVRLQGEDQNNFEILSKNRPASIGKLFRVIDGNVLLLDNEKFEFWTYNLMDNTFTYLAKADDIIQSDPSSVQVIPLIGKTSMFIFNQDCGATCLKPVFKLLDYKTKVYSDADISSEVINVAKLNKEYTAVKFDKYDEANNKISFKLVDKPILLIFDIANNTWSTQKVESLGSTKTIQQEQVIDEIDKSKSAESTKEVLPVDVIEAKQDTQICNQDRLYTFADGAFNHLEKTCEKKTIENNDYVFTYTQNNNELTKVIRTNKNNKAEEMINPVINDIGYDPYSPNFDVSSNAYIKQVYFYNNMIWYATEKGAWVYNMNTNKWNVLTYKKNLYSNLVQDMITISDKLIVLDYGGLSVHDLPLSD